MRKVLINDRRKHGLQQTDRRNVTATREHAAIQLDLLTTMNSELQASLSELEHQNEQLQTELNRYPYVGMEELVLGEKLEMDISGEVFCTPKLVHGFAYVGINDDETSPEGNRQTTVPTIAIGVDLDDNMGGAMTHMTWDQARKFAAAIVKVVDLAEFG